MHCPRCIEAGEVEAPPERRAVPRVHAYATERAAGELRRCLVHMRRPDADYLAQSLAHSLAYEPPAPIELVIARSAPAGALSDSDARKVLAVYVDAVREQGRVFRMSMAGVKRRRPSEAAWCDEHAARVERCLPAWMRARS